MIDPHNIRTREDLEAAMRELMMRFDTAPRNYTKADYGYLLSVICHAFRIFGPGTDYTVLVTEEEWNDFIQQENPDCDNTLVSACLLKQLLQPVVRTYTVSFNMNGHGAPIESQTVEENNVAVKPANPTDPEWNFVNWYTNSACTQVFSFTTPITQDITLYAKWTEKPKTYVIKTNGKLRSGSDMSLWPEESGAVLPLTEYSVTKSSFPIRVAFAKPTKNANSKWRVELPVDMKATLQKAESYVNGSWTEFTKSDWAIGRTDDQLYDYVEYSKLTPGASLVRLTFNFN